MRLASLRLAGFKSFVEPTEINFPSELVGIVGPNGCGKSNTLDALRWVMGESSARHLRGQSLEDVIFAGSGQRKPVAQASVELVFAHEDEEAGHLQGPWARFRDLSIRRVLTRDGQSRYFLNGARCRRKDIADLFLGTGLGRAHGSTSATRSYAIIEQGQINRLLEARPEEMRAILEEAAGISRYKERRRESEISIQHTRDNLARLNDLRDELARQLDKLERQAKAAERFRQWQRDAQRLELAQHALQWRLLRSERQREHECLLREETELEQTRHALSHAQERLEQARVQDVALQAELHQAQAQAYALAADTAQLEQAQRHAQAQLEQVERELSQLQQECSEHAQHSAAAQEQLARLAEQIAQAEAALQPAHAAFEHEQAALAAAERTAQQARQVLEERLARSAEPSQRLRVEQGQLEQARQRQRSLNERLQRLRIAQWESEVASLQDETERARGALEASLLHTGKLEQALERHGAELAAARQQLHAFEAQASALQTEISALLAEQRALAALEQAQDMDQSPLLRAWLARHGLEMRRVAEQVTASDAWAQTLDAVLADALAGVAVEALDAWSEHAACADTHGLCLVEPDSSPRADAQALLQGEYAQAVLNGLRPCASLQEALAQRHALQPGEAWLTPQGDRVSRHLWRRPPAGGRHHGQLVRRQRLQQLAEQLAQGQPVLAAANEQRHHARQAVQALESLQQTQQREQREGLRQQHELALRVEQLRARLEQTQGRLHAQRREQEELHAELEDDARRQHDLQQRIARLEQELSQHEAELGHARRTREQGEAELARQRQQLRAAERGAQEAQSRLQTLQREQELRSHNMQQQAEQTLRLEMRRSMLHERRQSALEPGAELAERLARARVAESESNARVQQARHALNAHAELIRETQQQVIQAEQALERARHAVEQRRLGLQALELRAEIPASRLAAVMAEEVEAALAEVAGLDLTAVQARLHDTQARLSKLGAVNLAALDELIELRAQQSAMQAQYADLNEALATLESAMRSMDQETRSRFRAIFEAVNVKLGETFTQLFGGGEARLELHGDADAQEEGGDMAEERRTDRWLDRGVVLLARPPGKKISHIHLLSGGEKSLTAIALVFAVFQLNPAPFCLLDEVDAPLDEANVGRFCAMVQAMSSRVQFIFITHNKTTMEMARHLIGVTMREAGVSRIVEVDLDAAVKMLDE
ncbi:MAG: chromosome segregation protein SMC [Pseudomonadota bacterium]